MGTQSNAIWSISDNWEGSPVVRPPYPQVGQWWTAPKFAILNVAWKVLITWPIYHAIPTWEANIYASDLVSNIII